MVRGFRGVLSVICIMMLLGCANSGSQNKKSYNGSDKNSYTEQVSPEEKYRLLGEAQSMDVVFKNFYQTSIKPFNYKHFSDAKSRDKTIDHIVGKFAQYCADRNGTIDSVNKNFVFETLYIDHFCNDQQLSHIAHIAIHLNRKKNTFSFHTTYAGIFNEVNARRQAVSPYPYVNINYHEMVRFEGELRIGNLFGDHITASDKLANRAEVFKIESYLVETLEVRQEFGKKVVLGAVKTSFGHLTKDRGDALPSEIAALVIIFQQAYILYNNGYRQTFTNIDYLFPNMIANENTPRSIKIKTENTYELVMRTRTGKEIIHKMVKDNNMQLVFFSNNSPYSKTELQYFVDESLDDYYKAMWDSLDRKL